MKTKLIIALAAVTVILLTGCADQGISLLPNPDYSAKSNIVQFDYEEGQGKLCFGPVCIEGDFSQTDIETIEEIQPAK